MPMSHKDVERATAGTEAGAESTTARRTATLAEARALAHPLRLRILRLCLNTALTNRQLADRLEMDPGTVLYHVRTLVKTGFLAPEPVRTGTRGALERPYRATLKSWRVDVKEVDRDGAVGLAMVEAFRDQYSEAGPASTVTTAMLGPRLAPQALAGFVARIEALVQDLKDADDPEGEPLSFYLGLHRQSRPQPPRSQTARG
jgi:hypothetical protein